MAQNLPSKIGKYEVLEVLGQGGMGTVYKGIDPLIGRLVAIKVIVADYIDNPDLLKRFYREAKAVGNLQHPNIVTVYDLGEEDENPYLVMQYLDGEALNKIIAARRELTLLQKLGIIAKVCDALAYAHQRDIVHRDVKPANVMLLKDGQVKLLDFGIARLGNSGHTQTETQKGQVMGTISYIAPEQLNEEIVDGRSDVYSTGVMLFELLTYRLPFESADLGSLIAKKLKGGPPPPLGKYLENYPPELDDIVARSLATNRDERYDTAQHFAFDIERLIERLKRDMVSDYVDRARACISSAELAKAKDILSEVLRIDTQHTAAKQLLYEVQESLQKQQRVEQVRQLRQHAEEAVAVKEFEDASKFVDQAIKLDRSDPDLLNLREQIQQLKQCAQQLKKLLHLAEVAQQEGELGVFQRAVADALELDPEDPQARVLQASLIRLQAEQEKDAKVQELLVAARRGIAGRQFDAAQEYIHKAEALDPHRNDIPALKQMVIAGQEQETRKRQLQQMCGVIQQELEANNLRVARDLADKALRAFPGEPALVRMKSAADSQLEAEERRRFVEARIAAASKLLEAGEVSRALSLIQEASRQFPTDTRLREFLQTVRQAVQESAVKREQTEMLVEARNAMQQKRFAEAVVILEAGQIKYPDFRDIGDLLSLARKEQEILAQKNKVADVSEQARTLVEHQAFGDAVSLLEKTVVYTPDPTLQQYLDGVRAQAAQFNASLDALKKEAMALLDAGHPAEALTKLQSEAGKFGQSSGFKDFLHRVEEQVAEEQESRQQVAHVLAEARFYLQRGALREAEAALAECQAKAPKDASVIALSSQLIEAKAALGHEREIQPPYKLEVPQSPETKTITASATAMFNPSAAVADLTPPAGTPVSPEDLDVGNWHAERQQIPAGSEGSLDATVLFEGVRAERAVAQSTLDAPVVSVPPEVAPEPELPPTPRRFRALILGAIVLAMVVAAVPIIWWQQRPTYLIVQANPGAIIRLDGKVSGNVEANGKFSMKVAPGSHQVGVDLHGYESRSESFTIKRGERLSVFAQLREIPPPPPPPSVLGTLALRSNVAGADVLIDGQPKGITDRDNRLRVQVDIGTHRVQLRKSGYQDSSEQSIEIVAKKEKPLSFTLRPIEGQTYLKIVSKPPGASVRIDDKGAGTTMGGRSLSAKVPTGPHTVQFNLDGYESYTAKVIVKEGETLPISAELKPKPIVPAEIKQFSASLETIRKGQTTKLKWDTQNATDVSIDGGVGAVRASGEREVDPPETKTYTLTAKGKGGSKTATVRITVEQPVAVEPTRIVSFAATDGTIQKGQRTKLKWETQNATDVSIDGGVGAVQASDEREVDPPETTTYTLTAKGKGGSKTATVRVTVSVPPPPPKDSGSSAPSVVSADVDGVREAVKTFKEIFEGMVAEDLRSIWPTITKKQIDAINNANKGAQRITLAESCTGSPKISGDAAEWACSETMTYVRDGKRQPSQTHPIVFSFKKSGGKWVVDGRHG